MTTLTVHSPDPSDRAVTKRVITIMQKLSYTSMVLTNSRDRFGTEGGDARRHDGMTEAEVVTQRVVERANAFGGEVLASIRRLWGKRLGPRRTARAAVTAVRCRLALASTARRHRRAARHLLGRDSHAISRSACRRRGRARWLPTTRHSRCHGRSPGGRQQYRPRWLATPGQAVRLSHSISPATS